MPNNKKSELTFRYQKPEHSPGYLLWQTTTSWQRRIKKTLEPFNISHSQFVIMAILLWFNENNRYTNQITIAHMSKLDKMIVSKSIRLLEKKSLLSITNSTQDARAKTVTLTEQGKTLIRTVVPVVEKIDEQFFAVLNSQERQEILKLLSTLAIND